jgi:hypothetical protein
MLFCRLACDRFLSQASRISIITHGAKFVNGQFAQKFAQVFPEICENCTKKILHFSIDFFLIM